MYSREHLRIMNEALHRITIQFKPETDERNKIDELHDLIINILLYKAENSEAVTRRIHQELSAIQPSQLPRIVSSWYERMMEAVNAELLPSSTASALPQHSTEDERSDKLSLTNTFKS